MDHALAGFQTLMAILSHEILNGVTAATTDVHPDSFMPGSCTGKHCGHVVYPGRWDPGIRDGHGLHELIHAFGVLVHELEVLELGLSFVVGDGQMVNPDRFSTSIFIEVRWETFRDPYDVCVQE